MKFRIVMLGIALAVAACSSVTPLQIAAGDICFRCRRLVEEPRLAAEMVDPTGHAFKFRTAGCLATYLKQHPNETGTIFVTDYKTGKMFPAKGASFVATTFGTGRDATQEFAAYKYSADANVAASGQKTTPIDWNGVLTAAPTN